MPAVGFYGPVGRAAASVRVPSIKTVARNATELQKVWKTVVEEQRHIRETGKTFDGEEAKYWVKDANLSDIDFAMNALIEAVKASPLAAAVDGPVPTAVDVVKDMKVHFGTGVLATVHCPAWLLWWLQSTATFLITAQRTCSMVFAHALQGGPMCMCGILFVIAFLEAMGFKESKFEPVNDWHLVLWQWIKKRPDGSWFSLLIYLHYDAEKIPVHAICRSMLPVSDRATRPNVKRAFVLSAPVKVHGTGERVDEIMNKKLVDAFETIQTMAEQFGFSDEEDQVELWSEALDALCNA